MSGFPKTAITEVATARHFLSNAWIRHMCMAVRMLVYVSIFWDLKAIFPRSLIVPWRLNYLRSEKSLITIH